MFTKRFSSLVSKIKKSRSWLFLLQTAFPFHFWKLLCDQRAEFSSARKSSTVAHLLSWPAFPPYGCRMWRKYDSAMPADYFECSRPDNRWKTLALTNDSVIRAPTTRGHPVVMTIMQNIIIRPSPWPGFFPTRGPYLFLMITTSFSFYFRKRTANSNIS